MIFRPYVAFGLLLAAGVAACGRENPVDTKPVDERFAAAVPAYNSGMCLPPDEREEKAFELAASTIELNLGGNIADFMEIGAQKFLSRRLFRRDGEHARPVCTPPQILKRVAAAFIARKSLGAGRLVEYQLQLAEQLPIHSLEIVRSVGASAFNDSFQQSEIFPYQDIRPYARTVLAGFGPDAREYGDIAYKEIDIATPMGTGAAQVAAAAHHTNALVLIQKSMQSALAAIPPGKAIPWEKKNRLYELAWAVFFAGEEGRQYTAPIHEIMKRKVESWAPPFGMVEASPKRFCDVLRRIEGERSLSAYSYCLDDRQPMDR